MYNDGKHCTLLLILSSGDNVVMCPTHVVDFVSNIQLPSSPVLPSKQIFWGSVSFGTSGNIFCTHFLSPTQQLFCCNDLSPFPFMWQGAYSSFLLFGKTFLFIKEQWNVIALLVHLSGILIHYPSQHYREAYYHSYFYHSPFQLLQF